MSSQENKNISFLYKIPFLQVEYGKICFTSNTPYNYNIIKEHIIKAINLYRTQINIFLINDVHIGILGSTNIKDIDEHKIFTLYITYNQDNNEFDYYYDNQKIN